MADTLTPQPNIGTPQAPAPLANQGQPIERIDARLKVMGRAKYGSDIAVQRPLYAVLVTSSISLGSIRNFDLDEASHVPGVVRIATYKDIGSKIKSAAYFSNGGYMGSSIEPMKSASIYHDGQIVAIVLGETFEAATDGAARVKVTYDQKQPSSTFDGPDVSTWSAELAQPMTHEDPAVGDAETALKAAEIVVEADYATPTQHHNPMELFTTTCAWSDHQLTIYEPSQNVYGLKNGIADQLGIDQGFVQVVNPYVGGAFGSRGALTQRTALIALLAREANRPVRLVATRDQGFTIATFRAETKHKVRLGASRDGKLTALSHEGWEITSRPDSYSVSGTDATTRMYACPNVTSKVNIVYADRNTPGFMRAPAEVPYMFALESAMDELAYKLGMDPIELRRVNDTMNEPIKNLPYTSRSLMKCFDQAAAAFDWSKRNTEPASMRDGDWLIGYGCATTCYPTQAAPSTARVRLTSDGKALVEIAAHEIGNGAYTVIAQTAAERLGLPVEGVTVRLGDTLLPPAPVAGGSITTASTCPAVAKACDQILHRLAGSPQGAPVLHVDNRAIVDQSGRRLDIASAFAELGTSSIEEFVEYTPPGSASGAQKGLYKGLSKIVGGTKMKDRIQFAFGAELVEVRVHARTREVRVPRIVGAFAAGRIVNPRTAHSQLMGGLIWGISSALHEATEIDPRNGRYVNDNLADYLIPVNADIGTVDVIFVPEEDTKVNPLGIKGLGELGNVGTNAAIANAVFHATGKRVRDLPIRLEKLLA
jgi:xanthine dehydrogenase YagR molybdenum-binding subunit